MTEPSYGFFPDQPVQTDPSWPPVGPEFAVAPAPSAAEVTRPAVVAVTGALLVAQAAMVAVPAFLLLLVKDVISAVLSQVASGLAGLSGGLGATVDPSTPGTGRLLVWGLGLLLAVVVLSVGAFAVDDRHGWGWLGAVVAEVGLLGVGISKFGDLPLLSGLLVGSVLLVGGLLVTGPVRRWVRPAA